MSGLGTGVPNISSPVTAACFEHSSSTVWRRTADSYHSLGVTKQQLGDLTSALHAHQRALEISLKLFGEEHASTADS